MNSFTRRSFLQIVAGILLTSVQAVRAVLKRLIPNDREDEAAARGKKLGVGAVRLLGPRSVTAYSHQTWTICYTAGAAGLKPGAGLRIALRHMQRQSAVPQAQAPRQENYITARADDNVPVKVETPNGWKVFMWQYFPWQNIIQVKLPNKGLQPGQKLYVTIGDRSGGSPGMRVQPFDEKHYGFKCFVDVLGDGQYLPVEHYPTIEVIAAVPCRLQVITPSVAVVGKPAWCLIRAEDRYGNPAAGFRGKLTFTSTDTAAKLPGSFTFSAQDRGVHRFENITFSQSGIHTIRATAENKDSELFQSISNPIHVTRTRPANELFWGDLHGHTLCSDGRDTVEEFYEFARRVVGLDFCAVTDHAFEMPDEMWRYCKDVTNRYNQPGRFVTFHGYEWSGATPNGGDHNVYFLDDDPPIFRSLTGYHPQNLQTYQGADYVKTVTELFDRLANLLTNKNVFCIPHWGGRRGNPKWHDPRVQRLIEIFSDHQRSEPWAATFLSAGHRLGIMAGSDNHYGNPGYGYLKIRHDWTQQEIGTSAVAVYAPQLTREAIFHALYDRRCYATTGDRIILDVQANGHPMGCEFRSYTPPEITVEVSGTTRISQIQILKNRKLVHTGKPNQSTVMLKWKDPWFQSYRPAYYYVRVIQENNELAISSPIWIN
jgi:hypothetical protein